MAQGDNGAPPTDVHLAETFERSVEEGRARLDRGPLDLMSTGLIGGIDVSLGILALLIVEHATGSRELGALAFSIGFIALTLGKSELFTGGLLFVTSLRLAQVGASTIREARAKPAREKK